jgi:hypothetical protein
VNERNSAAVDRFVYHMMNNLTSRQELYLMTMFEFVYLCVRSSLSI